MSIRVDEQTMVVAQDEQDSSFHRSRTREKIGLSWGSGCGSVGRAVASDTRGPQFESSHRQKCIY